MSRPTEKETYVRRRAFNKIHITSWLIYLEKDGFVRCPFQNCNFMAFDVNEMCDHYGFCKGDSNFAKYVCEVCNGCTVSEKRLHEHRSQAHNITILPEQADAAAEAEQADPGKPSRVLVLSWGFFFDKHNYIKCSNCQYIANTMSEMCRHYLVCKQEKKFLLYVCPECKGRSRDVVLLIQHLERAHKISKRPDQFNHISRNMVQFWEKELREDKYATCLHINSDKERDCQYIDVDVLGINEHSQTCKGPQQVISSRQWFCQFCPKWTNSYEKLTKHQMLSHFQLCNSAVQVENNDQSICPQSAAQIVKQDILNNSPKVAVPKRFSPANKFVSFLSKETAGSTKKEPNVPVKPFETVYIIKGDYDMGNPQEIQNTIENKNCVNELHPIHIQKETISAYNSGGVFSIPSSVKKCNGEKNIQDSIQSNVHAQASELVDSVNVNHQPETTSNNIIVEECSFSNPAQGHQEIFLDLVEDKLVARKSVDEIEKNMDLLDNVLRQKVCERQDNSMPTLHLSSRENDKRYEERNIEIIDVAEDEFISGKCVGNATNKCISEEREPEVIKIEEGFSFNEKCEIDGSPSGCIRDKSSLPNNDCSNKTLADKHSSGTVHKMPQELFQDEIEVIEVTGESSTVAMDQVKEVCQKKENLLDGSENKREKVYKPIKDVPCYVLFKDDSSSDEENCTEKIEKGVRKEDDIKLSFDWQSANKAYSNKPKNYTRRKSCDDKLERCSTKNINSLYNQISRTASIASELCLSGLAEIEKTTVISYKGKKSYENHYKTQMQTKNNLVFQNQICNYDESQEEASKNSEKNDKLMLGENPSGVLNRGPSNLSDKNQTKSPKKESVPGVERLNTSENYFGNIPNKTDHIVGSEDESNQESLDGKEFGCSKSELDEGGKLKPIAKTLCSKQNFVTSNEILSDFQKRGLRENKKSRLLNSTAYVEEVVQGNANKDEDCIDLTEEDSYESSKLKPIVKTLSFKQNVVTSSEILSDFRLRGYRESKSSSLNSTAYVEEVVQGNAIKGKDCIDLTEDDSHESSKGTNCQNSSSLNLISFKKSTNNEMSTTEENDEVSSEPKVVSFFYSGKLNKPFLGSNTSKNQKPIGNAKQSMKKTLLSNNLKFWSNEPSSSGHQSADKPLDDSIKNMEERNSTGANGKETKTNIAQVDNNIVDAGLKFDLLNRIQSDFLIDSSSDEETIGNKITVRSENSFVEIETAISSVAVGTSMSPVGIKTTSVPVGIESVTNVETLGKRVTDLERKIEVRRISSGFYEESSLDEEDFLGTDEELDMKDQFFNGFQEISEKMNSKNKRFRQFLNRLSESENEEWYVNAGNLSMDVRKDNSFSQKKSMNLKKNYEYDSLRSLGKDTTVIVVDNDSNDKEDKTHKVKSKLKENKEFIQERIHNTYIHKHDFMKDKPNKLEKDEMFSKKKKDDIDNLTDKDLLFNDSFKENSITFSSLDNRPIESLKISLSIDKLNLSSKSGIETKGLQRAERNGFEKAKVFKVNANNNSIKLISNKKELDSTVAEDYVQDLPDSRDYNSDPEVQKQSIREVDTANSNVLEPLIKNQSISHRNGMDISENSNNDLMINICFPTRKKDQVHSEINKNTLCNEIKINDQKENLLMPGIKTVNSETVSCKLGTDENPSTGKNSKDKPEIKNSSLKKQCMSSSECSNELKTGISGDVSDQIQETSVKNISVSTLKCCNSSLWEDEAKQNFKFDGTTYSDDEPLSVIQKACQSSVKAVLSTKGNLLTEGFSPHDHIQENNFEEERRDKKKQAYLDMTTRVVETNQNYSHDLNSDIFLCENIKTVDNGVATNGVKKRGRKPIRDQDEFKIKHVANNSDNDGLKKTPTNKTDKLQEISPTNLSNLDIAICDTSKNGEISLTALSSESCLEIDKSRFPEIPPLLKRRGRPPKRKVNEMSTNSNQGVDLNILYERICDDELLLSIYSEEVENILVSGISEGNKGQNCRSKILPSEVQSSGKGNQTICAGSKHVSPQIQHDLQNNTELYNISEIKVPKKRGRKPKLRLVSNSSECTLNTANTSVSDEVLKSYETKFEDVITNLSVEKLCDIVEVKVPKKRGRKPKLKLENNSSDCTPNTSNSSISDKALQYNSTKCKGSVRDSPPEKSCDISSVKVPKKRGRKPKLKLEIDNTECAIDTSNSSISEKVLQDDGTQFTDLVKASSTEQSCGNSATKVPKKRGRPAKSKSQSFLHIDSSSHCESSILEYTKRDVSENDETVCNQNIRSSNPHISSSENIPIQPDISQLECKEEETVLPKKRGRKPGSKLKLDSWQHQRPINLENETSNIPEKRGRMSSRNKLDKDKVTPDKNENLSISRRSKSAKLNSDMNDTTSEVSSLTDVDCNSLVTSELLGTDVILINEVKLNSSQTSNERFRKCKDKPAKKLEVSDDDDSGGCDPDKLFSSDDSDVDNNYEIPRQPNKRRKIDSDENCSASDGETEKKTESRAKKKIGATSGEKIYFKAKHRKDDKVVCGVCKQEMTYSTYRNHHAIFKHYMLTWLEGEESPVDMNNQKEVEGRLWFSKKRIGKTPFRCSICSLPKLSAVGFYSHIRFCGKDNEEKESLLVTCELCGVRLMPASFKPHMYMKHSAKPPEADNKRGLLDQTLIVKGPRAAATRAVEVIQQSQADCQDLEGAGSRSNSPDRKTQLYHLYLRPSRIVPPIEYRRWKDSLAKTHVVACAVQGCDFTANTTVGFRKHFFTCPFAPPRLYKCRVCSFTSSAEEPMVEHIEEKHEDEILNQPLGSDNESSDESDGEPKQPKAVCSGSSLPFKFLKVVKQQKKGGRFSSRKTFFTVALRWTLKLRESMFTSETLYPGAQPHVDHWHPLTAEVSRPYLPELRESIRFRGSDGAWQTLHRFHSCLVDGVAMLFAGGPVWATAWAPVPNSEEHQYLAVVPHPSVEHTHKMASLYSYPGLIQIWALGALGNTDGEVCSPRLVVGLAQQRGPVWGLAWCPAGAYSQERLGLLAAACGDGSVAVYVVPHSTFSTGDPLSCCLSVKPEWELKLGCEMMAQCTCVDWHSAAPHSIIAGGFANGMVALWDLATTSHLLKFGSTFLPFKVIEAHHSAVTAVRLSCTKENIHMMTASLDRATKFWRLDDTTAPVNSLRKASVTDAVMTNNWLLSISAYDDVYSINNSHVTGCSYRDTFTSANSNYILQPGTVWGLSFNDWLNACACASEMGKVNAFFRQQLLVSEDSKKSSKSALIEDLVSCSAHSIRDGSPVTSGFGPIYSDCASTMGLEFHFGGNTKEPKTASACSSDNMDSFPIRSFNTVSWNPNMSSFTWLAAGMQCGLVVIPRVSSVHPSDLADLFQHKDNR